MKERREGERERSEERWALVRKDGHLLEMVVIN